MSRIRKKTLKDYQMENQIDRYLMRRRFHADVQKLKAICKTNGWELGQMTCPMPIGSVYYQKVIMKWIQACMNVLKKMRITF